MAIKLPGIYVQVRGDYTQLQKDLGAAKSIVKRDAKDISDAMNNALAPKQVSDNLNKLITRLGDLNRAGTVTSRTFDSLGVDLGELQRNTGMTARQFSNLQSKMLRTQAAAAQERTLRNIGRQAGLTKNEVRSLGRQFDLTTDQIKRVNQQLGNIPKNTNNAAKAMFSMRNSVAAIATAYIALRSINSVADISDQYTNINSKLRLVTENQEHFNKVYGELFKISQETGSLFTTNAINYSNLALALKDMGNAGSEVLLPVFNDINKSLVVAGAAQQEVNSFMLQFKQALGANRMAGDEFKAMMEANSYWAGKFAEALETDMAGLYEMKEAGLLTTNTVIEAHKKMSKSIAEDFNGLNKTIARARNELTNAWQDIFAEMDRAHGGSNKIAQSISDLAKTITVNKDTISDVFEGLIAGGAMALESVGRVTRSIQGLAIVAASEDKSIWDWVMSSPEDMQAWQREFENGIAFLKDQLVLVRREITDEQNSIGLWSNKEDNLATLRERERQILDSIQRIKNESEFNRVDSALDDFFGELDKPASAERVVTNLKKVKSWQESLNESVAKLSGTSYESFQAMSTAAKEALNVTLEKIEAVDAALEDAFGDLDKLSVDLRIDKALDESFGELDSLASKIADNNEFIQNSVAGWMNGVGDSLNEMLWSSEATFDDIAKSFGMMISRMVIQQRLIKPIMEGLGSGNGIMGAIGSVIGFHGGGVVGQESPTFTRVMPVPPVSTLPKHHTGLGANEFLAVLERNETVFTEGQMARLGEAINANQMVGSNSITIPLTVNGKDDRWAEDFRRDLHRWIDNRIREAV